MFDILYHIFCETGLPVIALLALGIVLGVLMLTEAEFCSKGERKGE